MKWMQMFLVGIAVGLGFILSVSSSGSKENVEIDSKR